MQRLQSIAATILLAGLVSVTAGAHLNVKNFGTPCCSIVSVDVTTGIVTAKTAATGKTFRFKIGQLGPVDGFATKTGYGPVDGFQPVDGFVIKNRVGPVDGVAPVDGVGPVDAAKFLAGLRVGQKVWASLAGLVSIDGVTACGSILMPAIHP